MMTKTDQSIPAIWAIGGGKGGVGKSVIAVNLGIALAHRGLNVTLVDMDLGGANVHTLLGLATCPRRLDDFIHRRVPQLADTITPTHVERLGLIAGAGAGAANMVFAQKERLLRNLTRLPSEIVLLDLGAGSAFNVLDFWVSADLGIIVTVPEHTAVENANAFVRAAFYRRLARAPSTRPIRNLVRELFLPGPDGRRPSPREVLDRSSCEAGCSERILAALEGFSPACIINQARVPGELELAGQMARAIRDFLGIDARAAGALPADRLVTRAVRERRPVLEAFPGGPFSAAMDTLTNNLLAIGRPRD